MTNTDAQTFPGAFSIGPACYYFNFADPLKSLAGTAYVAADATAFEDCDECENPCREDAPIDASCEVLSISYNWRQEQYYAALDDPDPCGGVPVATRTGSGGEVMPKGTLINTVAICECETVTTSWVDAAGENAVDICCPDGWRAIISYPDNLGCCVSIKSRGLTPYGNYPNVSCCQGPFDDPDSPTGWSFFKTTYSEIIVACDDVP